MAAEALSDLLIRVSPLKAKIQTTNDPWGQFPSTVHLSVVVSCMVEFTCLIIYPGGFFMYFLKYYPLGNQHIPPGEKENHLQKCLFPRWDMLISRRVCSFPRGRISLWESSCNHSILVGVEILSPRIRIPGGQKRHIGVVTFCLTCIHMCVIKNICVYIPTLPENSKQYHWNI